MLDANSSRVTHAAQNAALIALSLAVLPLSSFIVFLSYVYSFFEKPAKIARRKNIRSPRTPYFQPRTVLVTGVGMSKGLALARNFYKAGHNVIGADFEPAWLPTSSGRVSKALKRFYKLDKPDGSRGKQWKYTHGLLDIIRREKVDVWVSCSGVASAVEDGMAKEMVETTTNCKAVQFDVETTKKFHEKHSFMEHLKSLNMPIPDTKTVTSRAAALQFLDDASKTETKYLMKYIGTDDSVRGDMTLLPLKTPAASKAHLTKFEISESRPWILQQFIQGPEYCTHSVVIRGEVKAFVACASSDLLMHYEALPPKSALSQAMLRFTQEIAAASGPNFTGHLSFDFLVETGEAEAALRNDKHDVRLYPIECNPRAHTAVTLFTNTPSLSDEYMTLLGPSTKKSEQPKLKQSPRVNGAAPTPTYPIDPPKVYWIANDLVTRLVLPVLSIFSSHGSSFLGIFESVFSFMNHLLGWQDGTFEAWDPLPAWWLYHIYWPMQFMTMIFTGGKWSRVNVSTCKMFTC